MKKALLYILNILSVLLILVAIAVSVLIFTIDNRYSEPVFGDTMLLTVPEGDGVGDIQDGSLAIIDLTFKSESGGYYAAFLGNKIIITRDSMASIGTVKGSIPYLGGVMDFFRNPLFFFLVIILPLTAIVIWHIIKIVLIIKGNNENKQKIRHGCEPQTEEASIDTFVPKGGGD